MQVGKRMAPAAMAAVMACTGCAVPKFDVPYTPNSGQPTISSIINRVKCELADLVRDPLQQIERGNYSSQDTWHEWFLLNGDYDVQITLSLEVNDTGGLTPSVTFMEPVTKLISFMFGGAANLSESRDHTFTDNFQLSMRQLYADAQMARDPSANLDEKARAAFSHTCPPRETNLSGMLGLKNFIAMGSQTERLPAESATQATPAKSKSGQPSSSAPSNNSATQAFGGTIAFLVTKNINGLGPTWTTTRWKGPGGLLGLSQVNTDKITLAFAQGPNVGQAALLGATPPSKVTPNGPNARAYNFQQQQITQSISSQLSTLLNQVP